MIRTYKKDVRVGNYYVVYARVPYGNTGSGVKISFVYSLCGGCYRRLIIEREYRSAYSRHLKIPHERIESDQVLIADCEYSLFKTKAIYKLEPHEILLYLSDLI